MRQVHAKWLATFGALLAFVGLLDATYLTVMHYTGAVPPCVVTSGCHEVLNSGFAQVGPLPLALVGAVYYLLMVFVLVAFIDRGSRRVLQLATIFSVGGALMSLWLLGVQVFALQAFCAYCLVSAAVCLMLAPTLLLATRARSAAV